MSILGPRPRSGRFDRLPPPRPKSAASERHIKCVPKHQQDQLNESAAAASLGTVMAENKIGYDERVEDDIWKGSCQREYWCRKNWLKLTLVSLFGSIARETNWGFIADHAKKNDPKEEIQFPERDIRTPFSRRMPNTRAQEFGSRVNTHIGEQMSNWQQAWNSGFKKKKMDKSLITGI